MKIISELFTRKRVLQERLAKSRQLVLDAERALTLATRLQTDVPKMLAAIRAEPVDLHFSEYAAPQDILGDAGKKLTAQRQSIAALERLASDLPVIKKHWQAVIAENAPKPAKR